MSWVNLLSDDFSSYATGANTPAPWQAVGFWVGSPVVVQVPYGKGLTNANANYWGVHRSDCPFANNKQFAQLSMFCTGLWGTYQTALLLRMSHLGGALADPANRNLYYGSQWRHPENAAVLYVAIGNVFTQLGSNFASPWPEWVTGAELSVRMEADGGVLSMFGDGILRGSRTDYTWASGYPAGMVGDNVTGSFQDNFACGHWAEPLSTGYSRARLVNAAGFGSGSRHGIVNAGGL